MNPNIIYESIIDLKVNFGYLVITKGKKRSFLGMNIEITNEDKIEIDMKEHHEEVIEKIGEEVRGGDIFAGPTSFFTVNGKAEKLDEERSNIFHSVTARLLYLMKRAHQYIEPLVSFLSTWLSKSNECEWKKMNRGLV